MNSNNDEFSQKPENIKIPYLPEPPTNCCFSGCANCVWIKYAEDLSLLFNDAEDKIKNIILNKIEDPNMKAFLLMELKSIKFKKWLFKLSFKKNDIVHAWSNRIFVSYRNKFIISVKNIAMLSKRLKKNSLYMLWI